MTVHVSIGVEALLEHGGTKSPFFVVLKLINAWTTLVIEKRISDIEIHQKLNYRLIPT